MHTAVRDYSVLATLTLILYLTAKAFPEQTAILRATLLPAPAPVPVYTNCRPCPRMRPPTLPLLRQLEA